MFVCCECCALSGRGLCVGLHIQRSPTDCGVSVIVNPRQCGGLGPLGAVARCKKNDSLTYALNDALRRF
jgi:hypothetical protein